MDKRLFIVGLLALGLLAPANSHAEECVSHDTPLVVNEEASLVIYDLGCFNDQAGADISVHIEGLASGGEVYVGADSAELDFVPSEDGVPGVPGWTRIPEATPPHPVAQIYECREGKCDLYELDGFEEFSCSGRETIPNISDEKHCGFVAHKWIDLNVGNDSGREYRYAYLHKAPSVTDIRVAPVSWWVTLRAKTLPEGEYQEVQAGIHANTPLAFQANVIGSYPAGLSYEFYCNSESPYVIASGPVPQGGLIVSPDMSCIYPSRGSFAAGVRVYNSSVSAVDELGVTSINPGDVLFPIPVSTRPFTLFPAIMIALGAVGIYFMVTRFRGGNKNMPVTRPTKAPLRPNNKMANKQVAAKAPKMQKVVGFNDKKNVK